MSKNEQFTLDEISASWLGTGKQIPVGQMMAWLIKKVERLHNQLVNAGEVMDRLEQETHDQAEQIETLTKAARDNKELNLENDYLNEQASKLDELEHKVAETADKCGVPHDNDFEATETLDRIADFYAENQEPAKKWWQVYQDRCEGAWVEATIVKELKADIVKLKESAENWKAADREKFDEITRLKDQISTYIKNGAEAVHELEQENTKLRRFLDRCQGYLLDAVNALESMPGSDEQWEKYQRWAERLRKQTVERIKRELTI